MTAPWTPQAGEFAILTRPSRGRHGRPVTDAVQVIIPPASDGMALVRFVGSDDTTTVPVAWLSPHPLHTQRGV